MDIMTHAKFHFNRLMLTLTFGIRASEPPPPPGPGEQLKRPGLIGLIMVLLKTCLYHCNIFLRILYNTFSHINTKCFIFVCERCVK